MGRIFLRWAKSNFLSATYILVRAVGKSTITNPDVGKSRGHSPYRHGAFMGSPWFPGLSTSRFTRIRIGNTTNVVSPNGACAHHPGHDHAGIEELFLLSRDLHVEGQVKHKGDCCRAASGTVHSGTYSTTGCLFLVVSLARQRAFVCALFLTLQSKRSGARRLIGAENRDHTSGPVPKLSIQLLRREEMICLFGAVSPVVYDAMLV